MNTDVRIDFAGFLFSCPYFAEADIIINGLYSEPRLKSQLRDALIPLQPEEPEYRQSVFKIHMSPENMKRLYDLLEKEKLQLIYELKRFIVEQKGEILVAGFDSLDAVVLRKGVLEKSDIEKFRQPGLAIIEQDIIEQEKYRIL